MVVIATAGGAPPKPARPTGPEKPVGAGEAERAARQPTARASRPGTGPRPPGRAEPEAIPLQPATRRRGPRRWPRLEKRQPAAAAPLVAMNPPVSGRLHGHVQPMGTESAPDRRGMGSWSGSGSGSGFAAGRRRRVRFVRGREAGPIPTLFLTGTATPE